jgi:hypothetical protein
MVPTKSDGFNTLSTTKAMDSLSFLKYKLSFPLKPGFNTSWQRKLHKNGTRTSNRLVKRKLYVYFCSNRSGTLKEGFMPEVMYALSIKQPWAALLVHGYKSIEVRSWPTARRGSVFIHAARIPDLRPEVWKRVPEQLLEASRLVGGIVGRGNLTACVPYKTVEAFELDQDLHWNDLSWFQGRVLYGFVFANTESMPFRAFPGWMRFFPVEPRQ